MHCVLILFSCQILLLDSAKILAVFPTPLISHQVAFRPLIQALVERGYEVTVITTNSAFEKGSPPNIKEIVIHDSHRLWKQVATTEYVAAGNDRIAFFNHAYRLISKIFAAQMAVADVRKILLEKEGEFDILLLEAWVRPLLALTYMFKVPVIQISSLGGLPYIFKAIGIPMHPLVYPTVFSIKCYNLTILEKIQELHYQWQLERLFDKIDQEDDVLLEKIFDQDIPPLRDIRINVDLLFLNSHTLWGDNSPVTNSVQRLSGIHQFAATQLPEDLQSYMDSSKNGVIYVSFGTSVPAEMVPSNKIQVMVKVLSQLPYDVIWKWNEDTLPGRSQNIKISKWLPQPDLLKHPNLKLFITQGGLHSTDEAIAAEVPVIGIPIMGDQWFNTEKYVYYKIGMQLDIASLTEDGFRESVKAVINDESYRQNIARLRTLMEDIPMPPLERAVRFIEYVLRHGGAKHLRSPAANLSWAEYYEIDLILIILFIIFLITSLVSFTLYYLLKKILIRFTVKLVK